ncbi:GTP pyrophosphokinase (RelA/SpoT) [Candidatus Hydrogenisulfobacillus filiaventi]|uniref:GTP diphosphokinase n=1 Tax=Candidatus Hydrogenisulfobacillus filiaventi TaxID=2707344 RepID=A0A6F8ZGT7_9FIRM|nr:bifunctional (p)ppGpp synthetase/guanosine-3',5'-bis(diphosphate) 3'-pyrophosphohydrolase [Bacillota bacterium]CAB1128972.1 GTP pyrophosphokinase (RelA/SpoT) [Candidatus Hydrogenisulfobacillus filiaventi]
MNPSETVAGLGFDPHTAEGARIAEALAFAEAAHAGQSRASGDPYIGHPLAVASIVADLHMDADTVIAALLHDVVEDTPYTLADIEARFGHEVAQLVDGVTKLDRLEGQDREMQQAENLRKMFLAMAKDIRVILIKLADRLHNMRTLRHLPPDRARRIARETREIYAPLAHRLGIFRIKWELEDLAFQTLEPEAYQDMKERVAKKRQEREAAVEAVKAQLSEQLTRMGLAAEVSGRAKHLWSIYQKMVKQGKDFSQIYDLVAVRVLVETVKDCYAVLGLVHSLWKPVPGRFKDYIAMPKSNLYQSLHTTVIGPFGEPLEVQIRTFEMHHTAEYGIAAHWRYKEGHSGDADFEQKLSWLRQLLEWQRDMRDAREFVETLKVDLFSDEVFVFTPKGAVIDLPAGATPLDFAYRIHTDVGHHCVGAKVNGHIVPLGTPLENGDIVEILVNRHSPGPSGDWLNLVRTSQARNRIRQWFRRERRQEHLARGQDLLERELHRVGLSPSPERLAEAVRRLGWGTVEDLAVGVSEGTINLSQAVARIREDLEGPEAARGPAPRPVPAAAPAGEGGSEVLVRGQANMLTRLARCCQPVPGDPIIGYLTRGRGITVHRLDCPNERALARDPDRLIEVTWSPRAEEEAVHLVHLAVYAWDRPGLLADVANSVAGANITNAKVETFRDRTAVVNLSLEVKNLGQLTRIVDRIRALPYVTRVARLSHRERQRRTGPAARTGTAAGGRH